MDRAEAYWDPRQYGGSGPLVDLSGHGHHAQLGSTSGGDANDPSYFAHQLENFLLLPGTAGNFASSPDHARLDILGDIEVWAEMRRTDYSSGTNSLTSKYVSVGNQKTLDFRLNAAGSLILVWTEDGSTEKNAVSTVTISTVVSDGDPVEVRATLDVDDGGGNRVTTFYWRIARTDSWTQLGAPITTAGTTSIFASTADLEIGARLEGTGQSFKGEISRVRWYNGIGGTLVFDWDATKSFTVDQANAAVVTINRSASAAKSVEVTRPGFLHFTDDFFTIADAAGLNFAAGEDFTLMLVLRTFGTPSSNAAFFAKFGAGNGYQLGYAGTQFRPRLAVRAGGVFADDIYVTAVSSGDLVMFTGVRKAAGGTLEAFIGTDTDGTDALANGDHTNALDITLGGSSVDAEFYGAALFREGVSVADIALVEAYFAL